MPGDHGCDIEPAGHGSDSEDSIVLPDECPGLRRFQSTQVVQMASVSDSGSGSQAFSDPVRGFERVSTEHQREENQPLNSIPGSVRVGLVMSDESFTSKKKRGLLFQNMEIAATEDENRQVVPDKSLGVENPATTFASIEQHFCNWLERAEAVHREQMIQVRNMIENDWSNFTNSASHPAPHMSQKMAFTESGPRIAAGGGATAQSSRGGVAFIAPMPKTGSRVSPAGEVEATQGESRPRIQKATTLNLREGKSVIRKAESNIMMPKSKTLSFSEGKSMIRKGFEVMDERTSRTTLSYAMARTPSRPRGTHILSLSMDEIVAFLVKVGLFKGLREEKHKDLCKACEECKFDAGECIVKQGDKGHEFFMIVEGEVSVVVDGWKVASLTTADYFGDCALIHNENRIATVMAETAVKCLRITREMFTELGLKDEVHFPSAQWDSNGIHNPKGRQVFADAAAMKEKIREGMMKPPYDVRNFYWTSGYMQKIARSSLFDYATLSIIAFNALWIAIDTDLNTNDMLIHSEPIFIVAENFFCLYFSAEWLIRYCSFRQKRDGFRDAWFVFDSALVFVMVVETWIMNAVVLAIGGSSSSILGDASILRMVRLLRLTRMARMARLLRAIPELLVLIKGMVVAMRSVFFTLLLLGGIIYIFAIAFVQLMKDTPVGDEYFSTVPEAMNALLLDGVLPDQAGFVAHVGAQGAVFKFLILVYILFASLTVMNMLVGVLCEVVSVVADVEKESIRVNYVTTTLLHMLESSGLDADGDYLIDKYEFQTLLDNPLAAKALSDVGVDVIGLVDFTDYIFKDDQKLSFPDFMEVVLQLRGSNNATVKDLVDLRKVVLHEMEKLSGFFEGTSESFIPYGPTMPLAAKPQELGSCLSQDGDPRVKALDGNRAASLARNTWTAAARIPLKSASTEGNRKGLSAAAGNRLSAAAGTDPSGGSRSIDPPPYPQWSVASR